MTRTSLAGKSALCFALAIAASACVPTPRGLCAADADCAGAPAGAFCAEGICQGPPRATLEDVPTSPLSRSATANMHVHVDRAHGGPAAATARFEAGTLRGTSTREPDGRLRLAVPLSFAPAGVEGPAAFAIFVADDLGHETRLAATLFADDLGPRILVDPASIPSAPVVRGAQVPLRVTLTDASPATLSVAVGAQPAAPAPRNPDGSFTAGIDTRLGAPNAAQVEIRLIATDSLGNAGTQALAIPITRLRWSIPEPNQSHLISLVLNPLHAIVLGSAGDLLFVRRDGGLVTTVPIGTTAVGEAVSDGEFIYVERVDNTLCKVGINGLVWCCGKPGVFGTLRGSPALGVFTAGGRSAPVALIGTGGSTSSGGQRLYAIRDTGAGVCESFPSNLAGSFDSGAPAIGSDGTIYAGATNALVTAQLDSAGFLNAVPTVVSERFVSQPALLAPTAAGQTALLTTDAAQVDSFLFPAQGDRKSVV